MRLTPPRIIKHIGIVATLTVVALLSGCGNRPSSGPSRAKPAGADAARPITGGHNGRSMVESPFAKFTAEEVSQIFHAQLQAEAEEENQAEQIAQLSFREAVPASTLARLAGSHAVVFVDEVYYAFDTGSGVARIPHGDDSIGWLATFYANEREALRERVASYEANCARVAELCKDSTRQRLTASLRTLAEQGELYVHAIGVRGTARELLALWDTTPQVFTIQIEAIGSVVGPPLFPETETSSWY